MRIALTAILSTTASLALLSAMPAHAQQGGNPSCAGAVHDDFDFWVGEWNVYAPDNGPYQGHNSITKVNGGCLIQEHWTGRSGIVGDSMNFYDPFEESWRQVWVSSGTVIDYHGALSEDGAMVLTGEIFYPSNGVRAPFRGTWTPQEDGTVSQFFEQQDDAGEWFTWFLGIYVRQDNDPRAAEAEAARSGG